jgi:hypothetical protein
MWRVKVRQIALQLKKDKKVSLRTSEFRYSWRQANVAGKADQVALQLEAGRLL